jgi:hypothetical protein
MKQYTYNPPERRRSNEKVAWGWAIVAGCAFVLMLVLLFSQCAKENMAGSTYRGYAKPQVVEIVGIGDQHAER